MQSASDLFTKTELQRDIVETTTKQNLLDFGLSITGGAKEEYLPEVLACETGINHYL